jgi:hypothetical protein
VIFYVIVANAVLFSLAALLIGAETNPQKKQA